MVGALRALKLLHFGQGRNGHRSGISGDLQSKTIGFAFVPVMHRLKGLGAGTGALTVSSRMGSAQVTMA